MSGWTPGPWQAFAYEIVDSENMPIAKTGTPHRPHPEERANARLIAAAPDLLEALIGLTKAEFTEDLKAYWAKAHAAIAKAEGRVS